MIHGHHNLQPFSTTLTDTIEIRQAPRLGGNRIDLAVEPGKLGGEQLVASCVPSR